MRPLRFILASALAVLSTLPMAAQQKRLSPHETLSTVIGERSTGNRVTITYGRPYTKSPKTGEPRVIWGGLVPWDSAYRLGADEATLLTVQQPVVLGSATLPAGAYTLYMVPSEKGTSKLAVSSDVGGWGDPVDTTHDVARVDLARQALEKPADQLTLALDKNPEGGAILRISWETTQFSVALKAPGPRVDFPAASPAATVRQRVGVTDIEVVYSRPSLKGRVMIGGIDPYGQVWRTGANSATRISFSTPVKLQGTDVASGTYELFTIPGKDEWTVILQSPHKQWGAYTYDAKNDVVRVTAKTAALTEPVETFSIGFGDVVGDAATLNLDWGTVRVPVALGVDSLATVLPQIDAAMAGSGKKPFASAAVFYLDHGLDLEKAAAWMDAAIAEQPDAYFLVYQKARILAKAGDKAGAEAAARQSIVLASKDAEPAKSEYLRLNEALIASLK